jgi:hypothetical protein
MKKIMISLLMVAATLNAFAVTYTSKAKLTLKSSDNKSCTMIIASSEDLNAGLNNGYYAELNEEGKAVQLYVVYGGKKYEQFASNAATMADLQLGIKTNASTSFTLTASNVSGSEPFVLKIDGVEYTVNPGMSENITLAANATLPAAGDEAKYKVNPAAPLAPEFCFRYNVLTVNGHDGESLIIKQGDAVVDNVAALGNAYSKDLSGYNGRLVVTLNGQDYQIDANPAVTPAN